MTQRLSAFTKSIVEKQDNVIARGGAIRYPNLVAAGVYINDSEGSWRLQVRGATAYQLECIDAELVKLEAKEQRRAALQDEMDRDSRRQWENADDSARAHIKRLLGDR